MQPNGITKQMANIVMAYVAKNHVQVSELPALLSTVYFALYGLHKPAMPAKTTVERPTPAQIRQSIKPGALVSFEDGKAYSALKRHLARFGLTPAAYRQKWGLPGNYPMVSANYSAARSAMAKSVGLGTRDVRVGKPTARKKNPIQRSSKR